MISWFRNLWFFVTTYCLSKRFSIRIWVNTILFIKCLQLKIFSSYWSLMNIYFLYHINGCILSILCITTFVILFLINLPYLWSKTFPHFMTKINRVNGLKISGITLKLFIWLFFNDYYIIESSLSIYRNIIYTKYYVLNPYKNWFRYSNQGPYCLLNGKSSHIYLMLQG